MSLQIIKLSEHAVIPVKAHDNDAGYDLFSTEDYLLDSFERKLIKTDISIHFPAGYYGRIADRSGNAYKKGLHVLGGVIDEGYEGNIGVILYNTNPPNQGEFNYATREYHNHNAIQINKGDRIAQLIFEKYANFDFEVVQIFSPYESLIELVDVTDPKVISKNINKKRSSKGFGSTGE